MAQATKRNAATIAALVLVLSPLTSVFEGTRYVPYRDVGGIWTVCQGETHGVDKNRRYTADECKAMLSDSLQKALTEVDACLPSLPDSVLLAFSDLAYNIGSAAVCKSGTADLLRRGQYRMACMKLVDFDKAKINGEKVVVRGLFYRRTAEQSLCLKDVK
jgi:lysozyme